MLLEEIIQRVLSSRPDLTREEVVGMIEKKEKDAEGFLTRESAARAVAAELGIEPSEATFRGDVLIGDLVSGLDDVTVTGRVIMVGSLRKFVRPDGTEGKVRRLFMADRTGEMKVLLWDIKADMPKMENLTGQIVRFLHGYVRRGFGRRLELNIGSRGNLEIAPPNVSEDECPPLADFIKKIGELTATERTVNVFGVVGQMSSASTFEREDGGEGKVRRLELKDESGTVTVVLWNSKVDELSEIESGTLLEVFNAKIREAADGRLELHAESSTDIAILDKERSQLRAH